VALQLSGDPNIVELYDTINKPLPNKIGYALEIIMEKCDRKSLDDEIARRGKANLYYT
jgi:hypothetical protein